MAKGKRGEQNPSCAAFYLSVIQLMSVLQTDNWKVYGPIPVPSLAKLGFRR